MVICEETRPRTPWSENGYTVFVFFSCNVSSATEDIKISQMRARSEKFRHIDSRIWRINIVSQQNEQSFKFHIVVGNSFKYSLSDRKTIERNLYRKCCFLFIVQIMNSTCNHLESKLKQNCYSRYIILFLCKFWGGIS